MKEMKYRMLSHGVEPFIVIYHNPVYLSVVEDYLPGATRKMPFCLRRNGIFCIHKIKALSWQAENQGS